MAARVAAHDWAATPLGPRERWSPSLKLIVSTILASQFPMALRWGPQFVIIYNDGYLPILGESILTRSANASAKSGPRCRTNSDRCITNSCLASGRRCLPRICCCASTVVAKRCEDAYFTVSYSPVPDDTAPSGIGGVLITAVETTKRVAAERGLREREAELARVQEIGQVGGVEVVPYRRFQEPPLARILEIHGLPPEAVNETHEDWVRRIHPDDRERTSRPSFDAVRGDAREYRSEYRIVRPSDGQVRWIHVRAEIERDADGQPLRLVGAHIDITERKRAEVALQQLNETLEQQVAERTRERDRLWRVSEDLIGVANFADHWVSDQSGGHRDPRLEPARIARHADRVTVAPGRYRERRLLIAGS